LQAAQISPHFFSAAKVRVSERKTKFYLSFSERKYLKDPERGLKVVKTMRLSEKKAKIIF